MFLWRTQWHHKNRVLLAVRLLGLMVLMSLQALLSNSNISHREHKEKLSQSSLAKPDTSTRAQIVESYGRLPLSFEANEGQIDSQVKFLSRGSGYSLFL